MGEGEPGLVWRKVIGRAETQAPPHHKMCSCLLQRASGRRECSENSLLVRMVTWLFTFKSITVKYNPDLGSSAVPRVICGWWTPSGYFHHYRKFFQGAFCRGRCWGWGLGTEGCRNDLGDSSSVCRPWSPSTQGAGFPLPGPLPVLLSLLHGVCGSLPARGSCAPLCGHFSLPPLSWASAQ